jgi:SAM-dependent methyltransferase
MEQKKFKLDPKKRFSSRVEDYIKYRPSYPQEIIEFLREKRILLENSIIADVGSGTGILSELFLKIGNKIFGIEPNEDMRNACEYQLKEYPNLECIDGSAESTGLVDDSVDLITAGQSFHWFDLKATKKEFSRILKPNGYVILIWNRRKKVEQGFLKEYEELLWKYGIDYKIIESEKLNFNEFFGKNGYEKVMFYNYQDLDYEGLEGRLLSTSYIPKDDHPNFKEMIENLKMIFNKYQKDGIVRIDYDTEVFYGKL